MRKAKEKTAHRRVVESVKRRSHCSSGGVVDVWEFTINRTRLRKLVKSAVEALLVVAVFAALEWWTLEQIFERL